MNRPRPLIVRVCLGLALLLLGLSGRPVAWLWRCDHSGRVVAASPASPLPPMVCRERAVPPPPKKNVVCCRGTSHAEKTPAVGGTECRYVFERSVSLPGTVLTPNTLRLSFAADTLSLPPFIVPGAFELPTLRDVLRVPARAPPSTSVPLTVSCAVVVPGLRAPPVFA